MTSGTASDGAGTSGSTSSKMDGTREWLRLVGADNDELRRGTLGLTCLGANPSLTELPVEGPDSDTVLLVLRRLPS